MVPSTLRGDSEVGIDRSAGRERLLDGHEYSLRGCAVGRRVQLLVEVEQRVVDLVDVQPVGANLGQLAELTNEHFAHLGEGGVDVTQQTVGYAGASAQRPHAVTHGVPRVSPSPMHSTAGW